MKKLSCLLVLSGLISIPAFAADSPHSLSANVGMTSNYVFRGISQSSGDPAIQGGLDYSHSSGVYLGAWGSNVSWIKDFQGYQNGSLEVDLYGGYRNAIGDTGVSYDVGVIGYVYPGNRGTPAVTSADTTEVYASLGWKWFNLKYSYATSSGTFGFANARGSNYLDLSASVPIGETGLTAGAHWGAFNFKNNGGQDYDDWKVSLAYDLGQSSPVMSGMTVGIAYSDTNANSAVWSNPVLLGGADLGKSTTSVWVSKSF
ncbi:MAG: TorF family putative porin [Pseudomonadota bacterium]|nr:TorF family putative porin [Pseudomonadota bacterium]